jgi:hypothetical protein
VRKEAEEVDQLLEEWKGDDEEMEESLVPVIKTTPNKTKGTKFQFDPSWVKETMNYYGEMQQTLHTRRDELKQFYPESMFQYDYDIQTLILNQDTQDNEEEKESQELFKHPDYDDIARCSEGFIHYVFRHLLDLYEDEWREKISIPDRMQYWIWYFLIMMPKPLLPDVAADLNDILSVYVLIKEHLNQDGITEEKSPYTMYDSTILIITEHFEQRFKY